jgi:hypothetical protein
MFVEGVLFLMKRKVKKGVKILTALIEGNIQNDAVGNGNSSPGNTGNESKEKELKKDISSASPINEISLLES